MSPRHGRAPRRALLALGFGGFGVAVGEFVTLGLLPNVASSLHVTIPQAGHLISTYALGVVVGAPLLTAAAVRLPRKGFLMALLMALAIGNFGSALTPTFDQLLVVRFLAGLPHGAYFGAATVAAANLAEPGRRSSAMAVVFAGLTVANIIGVPMATLIGQQTSWRGAFVFVGIIEILAVCAVLVVVPVSESSSVDEGSQLLHELRAFRNRQVWLTLGVATIGGGALFATFSYIAPMMTHLAGYADSSVTLLLALFGVGMTAGNIVGARLADHSLLRTIYAALVGEVVVALLFFFTDHNKIAAAITIMLFAFTSMAMTPALQSRLVALAGGAPNLAAASVHSAFNIANSLGAWLGGLTIAAGYGYSSPNLVAAGLAAVGLGIALTAGRLLRHDCPDDPGIERVVATV